METLFQILATLGIITVLGLVQAACLVYLVRFCMRLIAAAAGETVETQLDRVGRLQGRFR